MGDAISQTAILHHDFGSYHGCDSGRVELSVLGVHSLHVASGRVQWRGIRKEDSEGESGDADYGGHRGRYVHHRARVARGYTQGLQRRVDEA